MKTPTPKKPLRVLILTYIYTDGDPRYGGEGRVSWETTQALARQGVKVFVVTSMTSLKTKPHPNITLYKVPFAKKKFLNFNAGELFKMFFFCIPLLYLKRIDIIHHLPTSGPNPFARFKFGRKFAESADIPWAYDNPKYGADLKLDNSQKSEEAGYGKQKRDLSTRIALRFFSLIGVNESFPKGTDIFFCRSHGLLEMLKTLRPESKLQYVPNGVDPVAFNPTNTPLIARTQKGLRFLHVGSISRRKGVHRLVEAFIEVLKQHPECELIIGGRGEKLFVEGLHKMAAPYPQIKFTGSVPDEDLPNMYPSADVFCLVTLSGSTPTVLGEAMASGLPIIATRESGGGEAVEEHDAGFLAEPGDAQDLARAMLRAIEHPQELAEKKRKALTSSKFFTWDHIATALISGYQSVV